MKLCIALAGFMLWAAPLLAETYSWVDENGTYNFTEDYLRIPKQYRKSVQKRDGMDDSPVPAAPPSAAVAAPAGSDGKSVAGAGKTDAKTEAPEKLFGGKTWAAWQQELNAAQTDIKRLDARVKALAAQLKAAGPYIVNRSQIDLQEQYNAAAEEYNKAHIRYGELLESARKTGLPL